MTIILTQIESGKIEQLLKSDHILSPLNLVTDVILATLCFIFWQGYSSCHIMLAGQQTTF